MKEPDKKTIDEAVGRFLSRHRTASTEIKAALIDMDGTLYDSMVSHTAAWHRMVTELGISADRDEFYLYEGMTGNATINLIFKRAFNRDATADEVAELYHRKTVYFNELPKVGPMPGADMMLDTLACRGIKRVLVTGSGQASLIDRLERDFPAAFSRDMMITSRDVTRGKPDPEPYIKAMGLAGVEPTEAIVVENAPLGVKAGHASGAFTVALTTGPIPVEKMSEAGADIIFPSMRSFALALPMLLDSFRRDNRETLSGTDAKEYV